MDSEQAADQAVSKLLRVTHQEDWEYGHPQGQHQHPRQGTAACSQVIGATESGEVLRMELWQSNIAMRSCIPCNSGMLKCEKPLWLPSYNPVTQANINPD